MTDMQLPLPDKMAYHEFVPYTLANTCFVCDGWKNDERHQLPAETTPIRVMPQDGVDRAIAARTAEPTIEELKAIYPEVQKFATLMLRELWANRGKGDQAGWRRCSDTELWNEIQWHSAKLAVACKTRQNSVGNEPYMEDLAVPVREYAADTANMAMMLLDTLGLLPED